MKNLYMLLLIVMVTGCARSRYTFVETKSCTITGNEIVCPDGTNVKLPANGLDGTNGQDGSDGKDGVDGIDGADGQNGVDGTNGVDGQDALPIEIVVVCANQGNAFNPNEILLRFPDGSFIAYFKNLGLVELVEFQTYQTTDSFKCKFQIQNGEVILL